MPGFDGTGPWGQGPGTGRGLGPCLNGGAPAPFWGRGRGWFGFGKRWFGRGRGWFGFGKGRGFGRGWFGRGRGFGGRWW